MKKPGFQRQIDAHRRTMPAQPERRFSAKLTQFKPHIRNIEMDSKLLLSGNHLELTDALKTFVADKTEKLFRHEPKIDQLRVELSLEHTKAGDPLFRAHGIISIQGPNPVASETSADMHHSIEEMVKKLDRMLRNRARYEREKRNHPHPIDLPSELPKV